MGLDPNDDAPQILRRDATSLMALPLVRRANGVQILTRPQSAVAEAYAQRLATRRFKRMAPVEKGPGEIAVDMHVHTCFSHDSLADPSDVLRAAARRGLDAVAITDHDTADGGRKALVAAARLKARGQLPPHFVVIPGEEISTRDGHVVALFIRSTVPSGMSAAQTVEAIHRQGGLAVAAHPQLDGSVGALANLLPFDAVETRNAAEQTAFAGASDAAAARRTRFYENVTRPRLGGSDSHVPATVGVSYTLLQDCEPTLEGIRAAILSGRANPKQSVRERRARTMARKPALRSAYALRSAFGSNPAGLSKRLQRMTGADSARVSVFPVPGIRWSRSF